MSLFSLVVGEGETVILFIILKWIKYFVCFCFNFWCASIYRYKYHSKQIWGNPQFLSIKGSWNKKFKNLLL